MHGPLNVNVVVRSINIYEFSYFVKKESETHFLKINNIMLPKE